jgi:hypothetical protein
MVFGCRDSVKIGTSVNCLICGNMAFATDAGIARHSSGTTEYF